MKLLKKTITELEVKASKYYVMDSGLDNFGVKVYPSGKKSYIVRIRFNGSKKEYVIADTQDKTLAEAKDKARDIIKQYRSGVDVKSFESKQKAKDKTFNECIKEYLPKVKPTTQKDVEKCKKAWGNWLNKPIRNITSNMILQAYDKRFKVSRHRARLEMAYLRSIWNHFKKELVLGESPTTILNSERKGWSKKTVASRRLDFETSSSWYKAIQTLSVRDRQLFTLIYYTGLRASEAMSLQWTNININEQSLHIKDTKNGEDLNIPLNSQAMQALQEVFDSKYKHKKYVFPQVSTKTGKVSEMKGYAKPLTKLKNQGVKWSPHDSRRGFIVGAGVIGANNYIVKQLTNHIDNADVHASYQHYTVAEMRETAQNIGNYLYNQINAGNVVEFKKHEV